MPSPTDRPSIYLDYNATAPVRPAVMQAVVEAMALAGNPSSVHSVGRDARGKVVRARKQVAALAGVSSDRVIFTSGGTEANNQALAGFRGSIMTSAVEHPSVMALAGGRPAAPVDASGVIDLEALGSWLERYRPAALAIMLANNETGVIQPVREAAVIAKRFGVRLHVDAVQAAGKMPIRLADLGADTLSLSAHKIGGPQGVGALILGPGIEPSSLLRGGAQEQRFRAGTENVPGIVGFGEAVALAADHDAFVRRVAPLRDRLESQIRSLSPAARIIGAEAPRLANTSCVVLPGLSHDTQLIHYDLAGIAVSAGSACSSGKVGPSAVLKAMGVSDEDAACAIRISFGWASGEADVDSFIDACRDLLARHQIRRTA